MASFTWGTYPLLPLEAHIKAQLATKTQHLKELHCFFDSKLNRAEQNLQTWF